MVPVAIELWTPDEGSDDGPVRVFTPLNTHAKARLCIWKAHTWYWHT